MEISAAGTGNSLRPEDQGNSSILVRHGQRHHGIEYGLMAAYAEGFNVLRHADAGRRERREGAETTPLEHLEHYQYDLDLLEIAERRGSVIGFWLLDLTASALRKDPERSGFEGREEA